MEDLQQIPSTDSQNDFAKEFTRLYGVVSADMSWMTVAANTAKLDLNSLTGSFTIRVYTTDPRQDSNNCYLLAEYPDVSGERVADIPYDFPLGLQNIYISAISQEGNTYTTHISTTGENIASFDGLQPDTVMHDHKTMAYRICYEGFTDGTAALDFDYNDVVAEIEYVRGREDVLVNVLAAGCECAAKLVYHLGNDPQKGDEIVLFEEIHDALGFPGWFDHGYNRMHYPVLNTGVIIANDYATANFTISNYQCESITQIAPKLFAYFTIPSNNKKDTEKTTSAYIPSTLGSQHPQAILIADPTWEWVHEAMLFSASYSLFRSWIADPGKTPFWYGGKIWKEANKNFE